MVISLVGSSNIPQWCVQFVTRSKFCAILKNADSSPHICFVNEVLCIMIQPSFRFGNFNPHNLAMWEGARCRWRPCQGTPHPPTNSWNLLEQYSKSDRLPGGQLRHSFYWSFLFVCFSFLRKAWPCIFHGCFLHRKTCLTEQQVGLS